MADACGDEVEYDPPDRLEVMLEGIANDGVFSGNFIRRIGGHGRDTLAEALEILVKFVGRRFRRGGKTELSYQPKLGRLTFVADSIDEVSAAKNLIGYEVRCSLNDCD